MAAPLSESVKQLIAKARIVSFASWYGAFPPAVVSVFQVADDEGRYLSDSDLERISALSSVKLPHLDAVRTLRDDAAKIVADARARVLETYPGLTEPGGGLYPPVRAEACWRDFWHFLRCVTYGIASDRPDFTSEEGLHYMELLYRELNVPLDAMVLGLEQLQSASFQRLPHHSSLSPFFGTIRSALANFR